MNRHWASEVAIGDFCITGSGGTPNRSTNEYFGGSIPWVKSGELREGVITRAEEHITDLGLQKSSAKIVPAGALLLAMYGATVGRLAVLGIEAATNQAICNIRPDPLQGDVQYLFHALQAKVPQLIGMASGGAQPNISQDKIRNTRVRLPPLDEQRRIAAILDKADALRQKRKRAIALLDSLTQSIFLEMFGDVEVNNRQWSDSVRLDEVAAIGSGITKGRPDKGALTRSVPYMAVSNVQERSLDLSTIKAIAASETEISKFRLQYDDLLLTEGGDPDKLGRGTLWRDELPEAIHQNHIFRVRFTSANVVPLFANWLIGSTRGKRYFLQSAKQTTGIASINKTQLSSFPMLVPPLDVQQLFAHRAGSVERQTNLLVSAATETEQFFASLQHRAFSGQL